MEYQLVRITWLYPYCYTNVSGLAKLFPAAIVQSASEYFRTPAAKLPSYRSEKDLRRYSWPSWPSRSKVENTAGESQKPQFSGFFLNTHPQNLPTNALPTLLVLGSPHSLAAFSQVSVTMRTYCRIESAANIHAAAAHIATTSTTALAGLVLDASACTLAEISAIEKFRGAGITVWIFGGERRTTYVSAALARGAIVWNDNIPARPAQPVRAVSTVKSAPAADPAVPAPSPEQIPPAPAPPTKCRIIC